MHPMKLIQYLEAKRDYAQAEIDRETSQLNAYYQGLRDLSVELLAKMRDGLFNATDPHLLDMEANYRICELTKQMGDL